jgi:hypothetical protein
MLVDDANFVPKNEGNKFALKTKVNDTQYLFGFFPSPTQWWLVAVAAISNYGSMSMPILEF